MRYDHLILIQIHELLWDLVRYGKATVSVWLCHVGIFSVQAVNMRYDHLILIQIHELLLDLVRYGKATVSVWVVPRWHLRQFNGRFCC